MSALPTTPPLAAAPEADIQSLVHKSLSYFVQFAAFPMSYQALPILKLHREIYNPKSEFFVDFLYGLMMKKDPLFPQPPPGTDYNAFIAQVLRDRVLLDTRGVWIAKSAAERNVMHTYLNRIRSLPDLAFRQAYGEVPTEWLFPVFFGPDAVPLHLSSLPGVSWWLPAPRSARPPSLPGSSVQSDADHLSDSESLLSELATSA
jgi:hypothetical protein